MNICMLDCECWLNNFLEGASQAFLAKSDIDSILGRWRSHLHNIFLFKINGEGITYLIVLLPKVCEVLNEMFWILEIRHGIKFLPSFD